LSRPFFWRSLVIMSRRSRPGSRAQRFGASGGSPDRFARRFEPLEYPAKRFFGDPEDPWTSTEDLISTSPDDSRRRSRRALAPVRQLGGFRASSLIPVRASLRVRTPVGGLRGVIFVRELPLRAVNCAHRVIRKEVLFARRLTGKGSSSRRRRRSERSDSKC